MGRRYVYSGNQERITHAVLYEHFVAQHPSAHELASTQLDALLRQALPLPKLKPNQRHSSETMTQQKDHAHTLREFYDNDKTRASSDVSTTHTLSPIVFRRVLLAKPIDQNVEAMRPGVLSDNGLAMLLKHCRASEEQADALRRSVTAARKEWRGFLRDFVLHPPQDLAPTTPDQGPSLASPIYRLSALGLLCGEVDMRAGLRHFALALNQNKAFMRDHPHYTTAEQDVYDHYANATAHQVLQRYPEVFLQFTNTHFPQDPAIRQAMHDWLAPQDKSYNADAFDHDTQLINVFARNVLFAAVQAKMTIGDWLSWLNVERPAPTKQWVNSLATKKPATDISPTVNTLIDHWPSANQVADLASRVQGIPAENRISGKGGVKGQRKFKNPYQQDTLDHALPDAYDHANSAIQRLKTHNRWADALADLKEGQSTGTPGKR